MVTSATMRDTVVSGAERRTFTTGTLVMVAVALVVAWAQERG